MQITNNPNSFKAGRITYAAERAITKRANEAKFNTIKEKFLNKYKDSDIDVELGTTDAESLRLSAKISKAGKYKDYIEENLFSSIFKFRKPENFIKKLDYIIENKIKPTIDRIW